MVNEAAGFGDEAAGSALAPHAAAVSRINIVAARRPTPGTLIRGYCISLATVATILWTASISSALTV
jgi:hypothetical protein